ncbi:hypothetical protein BGZ89_012386 [Linnemannia elongata]|nr:hypothetical protein BGZ89_012386 [Linnemannia elongata]
MARTNTASFLTLFLVLLVVMTVLVASTEATQWACTVSTGNWDGGSCGLSTWAIYSNFKNLCLADGSKLNCWN